MCYNIQMKNKEQLLYFFLQGKISLSQYDFKFMANLQTMIQRDFRVTSGQAKLFDTLISKYKKQLTKQGFVKEELKQLPWKATLVESTAEYTGASVTLLNDDLILRVPFNKTFISKFREVKDNSFDWDRDNKVYRAKFSTRALRITTEILHLYFPSVRYCDTLRKIISDIDALNPKDTIWNPTLCKFGDNYIVVACNNVLGELLANIKLNKLPKTFFELSLMGIDVDASLYADNPKMEFAAKTVYETEITEIEQVIGWMKNIGCDNVILGRGLRNIIQHDQLKDLVEKYGMRSVGPMSFGALPDGVSMLIQHTSSFEVRNPFTGSISKTIVIRDSRPIEVK